jgi:hypothetical protein
LNRDSHCESPEGRGSNPAAAAFSWIASSLCSSQ